MKTCRVLFLGTLAATLAGLGWAQTTPSASQPPPGPLLRRAPDYAQWVVTFRYPGESPADNSAGPGEKDARPDRIRQLTVTKTKPVWHTLASGKGGTVSDCWGDGKVTYLISKKEKEAIELNRNQNTGKFDLANKFTVGYETRDFPDMDWVSPETFKGFLQQNKILIFQNSGDGETVYVDATTRLPIRWQTAGEVRDFRFLPPPSSPLALPEQVAATQERARKFYDASMWPPPKRGSTTR